jgi:signal transduction histidine kinase
LQSANKPIGVLVFALKQAQAEDFKQQHKLLHGLCKHIAASLATSQYDTDSVRIDQSAAAYQHKIQEAVHEASNPLSIIHNYLEMLRIKLGGEHDANENLSLIKEEIERVSNILNRLKEQPDLTPSNNKHNAAPLNINRVIEDTAQIIKESICVAKKLSLQLHLDKQMTEIQGDSNHLKQILTNLLKNAAEALAEGGNITISSDNHTSFSGRDCVSISVIDNGPGLPADIMEKLFYPVTSSKGKGHSGLGLSIVKKLVDEMNGYIVCRSNKNTGTEFQILLPKAISEQPSPG